MKKKKNIFYLSYDGLLDPLGLSQIVPYLILISNNYNLEVISFEKKNKLNERIFKILKNNYQIIISNGSILNITS